MGGIQTIFHRSELRCTWSRWSLFNNLAIALQKIQPRQLFFPSQAFCRFLFHSSETHFKKKKISRRNHSILQLKKQWVSGTKASHWLAGSQGWVISLCKLWYMHSPAIVQVHVHVCARICMCVCPCAYICTCASRKDMYHISVLRWHCE